MKTRTLVLVAVAVVVLVIIPLGLAGTLWLAVSSGAARRWATEQAQRALHHQVRIAGSVHVAVGLVPKLVATKVSVLNPPGFAGADLAQAGRIEARVALLPLLGGRIEVRRLRLDKLDVTLETNAAGQANWRPVPGAAQVGPTTSTPARRFAVVLRSVEVTHGALTWNTKSVPLRLDLPHLIAKGGDTLALSGNAELDRLPLTVGGSVGAAAPWPAYVTLSGNGVSVAVHAQSGGSAPPSASIEGQVNGAAIAPVFGPRLADLGPIAVSASWTPGAAKLHAQAGPGQLPGGVRLNRLTLDAPALDQPLHAAAELSGAAQLSLAAEAGTPDALFAGRPSPIALSAWGAGGTAELRGTIAKPLSGRGLQSTLSAHIADLGALVPGAPAVRNATVAATVITPSTAALGVTLRALTITLPQGDLAGSLDASWHKRPVIHGALTSQRIDVDAIAALLRHPAALPPPPAMPVLAAARQARLIPDTKLPLAGLTAFDADVEYSAAAWLIGGTALRNLQTHIQLKDGRLQLDPIAAVTPGGAVQGKAELDASASPPVLTLRAYAAGLDLGAILPGASGTLQMNADLGSSGTTWRKVAAGLGGEMDATMANGALDPAASPWLHDILRASRLPVAVKGQVPLRCVAIRAQGTNGLMRLNPMLLDAERFVLRGNGQVNLSTETPDLHLRVGLRFGRGESDVPLLVSGTFEQPKVTAEAIAGRFGLMPEGGGADGCSRALSAARGGRPGPVPAPLKPGKAEKPIDILRKLLR